MIDLDNEEHRAALAWACIQVERKTNMARELLGPPPKYSTHVERADLWKDRENAIRAISSSVSAAELIRRLVERAGAHIDVECVRQVQWRIAYWVGNERVWFAINFPDGGIIPRTTSIIARLLALSPGAGAEAVLVALRGET